MDRTYNDIFENLFYEFPINNAWGDEQQLPRYAFNDVMLYNLREVRNYIASVVNNGTHGNIRPDAKLFLIANYYHLVLLPVLLANYKTSSDIPITAEFKKKVNGDVDKILIEARKILIKARKHDQSEITSHTILTAIDNIWTELFTTVKISWSGDRNN